MVVLLDKANESELEIIHRMQLGAFAELLERYRDYDTNPGNESVGQIEARFSQPQTTYYFIAADGVRVGALRVVDFHDERKKRISPIFVMPEYRNRGIAQRAILEAERLHGAHGWALSTILEEEGNCHLYEKMGYCRTGELEKVNDKMTLIFYEKD